MADDIADDDELPFVPIVDEDGRVTGVMDQMAADYLSSTVPSPTQATLDAIFSSVTRVRLVGYRTDDGVLAFDVVRLDITDPASVADLRAALRIAEDQEFGHVLTIGDHHLELWAGEEHIATLELLYWNTIRWPSVWRDDARLAEPRRFEDWLLRHGISDAREQREEDEQHVAEWRRGIESWERALPPSLRALWPERLGDLNPDIDTARALLEAALPDPAERVRALYEWFGTGEGPWSGFPAYEDAPEKLLLEYPIETLLAAVDARTSTYDVVLGAARLFAGWDFGQTRRADRARCPEPLRQQMLHAVRRQGIADNLGRFRHAFDLPES